MTNFSLPGFELIEKVGEGGMGQVWKARQLSLDRLVAIKFLPPRLSHDPESIQQIIKEARTTAKLKHPGIVHVYDASEQDGHCCLVMEFIDGYNVGQWIARKKVLSCKDALLVVESVAVALNYAWREAGLIHCDIKPENIMIDHDGTIKVADLGLSLTRDSQGLIQASDEIAGTPGYISPEQVQGEIPLDCRTDIYALGCCLYQMVTGVRPFHNLSDREAMDAQVFSRIPDPREIVPEIPVSICALIEWMLVKDREHRLADWDAVLKELHRVQRSSMSTREALPDGASTMRRRAQSSAPVAGVPVPREKPVLFRIAVMLLVGVGVAAVQVGWMWWYAREKNKIESEPIPTLVAKVATNKPAHVAPVAPPSREREIELASKRIQRTVDSYLASGKLSEGIQWLENYSDVWAKETQGFRRELATSLREKKAALEAAAKNLKATQVEAEKTAKAAQDEDEMEVVWSNQIAAITSCVLSGKYSVASQMVEASLKDDKLKKHRPELVSIGRIVADVGEINDKLLKTFEPDIGKDVTIPLMRGPFKGRLIAIRDRKLILKTMDDDAAQINLRLDEISPAERQARLLALDLPEGNLVRGVAAYNAGKDDEAEALLSQTGSVLGGLLVARKKAEAAAVAQAAAMGSALAAEEAALRADLAFQAFAKLVKKAGIDLERCELPKMKDTIEAATINREAALLSDRAMDSYLEAHGTSPFAEKHAELILAFQSACGRAIR